MTIDQAKERFADLLVSIEKSMDAQIDEVKIKRTTAETVFNGKPFEKSEVKVTIIFS